MPKLYTFRLRLALGQGREIVRQNRLHIRRGIWNELNQYRCGGRGSRCFLGGVGRRSQPDLVWIVTWFDRIQCVEHLDVKGSVEYIQLLKDLNNPVNNRHLFGRVNGPGCRSSAGGIVYIWSFRLTFSVIPAWSVPLGCTHSRKGRLEAFASAGLLAGRAARRRSRHRLDGVLSCRNTHRLVASAPIAVRPRQLG